MKRTRQGFSGSAPQTLPADRRSPSVFRRQYGCSPLSRAHSFIDIGAGIRLIPYANGSSRYPLSTPSTGTSTGKRRSSGIKPPLRSSFIPPAACRFLSTLPQKILGQAGGFADFRNLLEWDRRHLLTKNLWGTLCPMLSFWMPSIRKKWERPIFILISRRTPP